VLPVRTRSRVFAPRPGRGVAATVGYFKRPVGKVKGRPLPGVVAARVAESSPSGAWMSETAGPEQVLADGGVKRVLAWPVRRGATVHVVRES